MAPIEPESVRRQNGLAYPCHNAPQGRIAEMRHPVADREDLQLVHVTHFNDLFWDAGTTPTQRAAPRTA